MAYKINEIKFKKYADEIMSLNPSTFFRIQKQQITNIFQIVILLCLQCIKRWTTCIKKAIFKKQYDGYIFSINPEKLPICFKKP